MSKYVLVNSIETFFIQMATFSNDSRNDQFLAKSKEIHR